MVALNKVDRAKQAEVKRVVDKAIENEEISFKDYRWVELNGTETQKKRLNSSIDALKTAYRELTQATLA